MGNQVRLYHDASTFGLSPGIQYSSGREEPPTVCFRCGVCCTKYRVRLTLVEARRIAEGLGLTLDMFLDRYADQRWHQFESLLLSQQNGACVFLEQAGMSKTRCVIHHLKPLACQEWTPSLYSRECREGLSKYWGLTVSPSGQFEGPEEKLRDFHCFIESLTIAQGTDANVRI